MFWKWLGASFVPLFLLHELITGVPRAKAALLNSKRLPNPESPHGLNVSVLKITNGNSSQFVRSSQNFARILTFFTAKNLMTPTKYLNVSI